ncbi:MAG TPA: SurA N-terminal domain-containing protein [Burkholderiales bacterium]|nr:SurA N-terminal domain-containing protein [Burkholderiales bacterium]
MFDLVHKYKKLVVIILGLIAITFATWGIESYTTMVGGREVVATVNGMEISAREFQDELQRQQDQLRQLLGQNFDTAELDTPESRRAVLERLINERLVASEAARADLAIGDEALVEAIHSIPAFRDAQGNFSRTAYESVLRTQNPPMTPAQFESRLRYDLALAQLARAVGEAAIPSRTVTARLAALEAQKREIAEARIPAQQFLPQVKVDEAQAKAHYEANKDDYRTPERIKAEYVMLSAEAIAAQEKVTPEEVRQHWESAYGPKLREKEEARKKAQTIAAEVRKDPARFAELAKRESQDPGTKDNGGDLGFTSRGSFVKPFEDALYKMKPGQISEVIESEFGFHVIQLTGVRKSEGKEERRASHILITAPVDAKPFEALRGEIEAELKKARAAKRYAEASEDFRNVVYEQFDSLKPAAERFGLKIQTTDWISRSPGQELGALDNPKLLGALFSADSLQSKRNTDAIEVAPATLVAARVVEHQPAAERKFEEVRGEIMEMLRRRQAAELAQKEGAAKLEALRKGEDAGLKWSAPRAVSRREAGGLPGDVLRQVMSADAAKLPAYVGVPADLGYVLLKISRVIEADPKAQDAGNRPAALLGAAQYDAFVASLRAQADVEINQRTLEKR